jgi:hypothetical protein
MNSSDGVSALFSAVKYRRQIWKSPSRPCDVAYSPRYAVLQVNPTAFRMPVAQRSPSAGCRCRSRSTAYRQIPDRTASSGQGSGAVSSRVIRQAFVFDPTLTNSRPWSSNARLLLLCPPSGNPVITVSGAPATPSCPAEIGYRSSSSRVARYRWAPRSAIPVAAGASTRTDRSARPSPLVSRSTISPARPLSGWRRPIFEVVDPNASPSET